MTTLATATIDRGLGRPTRVEVALTGARARVSVLAQGAFIAVRPQRITGSYIRVALVGIHMALLGGDAIDLRVRVGKGAALEVVEPTGLVAYNTDGSRSAWNLRATVDAGAMLIWQGAPFVAAQGSHACRSMDVKLHRDARALVKETLVLGRSAESAIRLRSRTVVEWDARPLLVEDLDLDEDTGALPGIVAPAKVIGTVMALGWRPRGDSSNPHRLDLAGRGVLFRTLQPAMHRAEELVLPRFADWRRELLSPNE